MNSCTMQQRFLYHLIFWMSPMFCADFAELFHIFQIMHGSYLKQDISHHITIMMPRGNNMPCFGNLPIHPYNFTPLFNQQIQPFYWKLSYLDSKYMPPPVQSNSITHMSFHECSDCSFNYICPHYSDHSSLVPFFCCYLCCTLHSFTLGLSRSKHFYCS